jgi:hypothetical protein
MESSREPSLKFASFAGPRPRPFMTEAPTAQA